VAQSASVAQHDTCPALGKCIGPVQDMGLMCSVVFCSLLLDPQPHWNHR